MEVPDGLLEVNMVLQLAFELAAALVLMKEKNLAGLKDPCWVQNLADLSVLTKVLPSVELKDILWVALLALSMADSTAGMTVNMMAGWSDLQMGYKWVAAKAVRKVHLTVDLRVECWAMRMD